MGKPGHVAFREGFLEEVMSKMVPDGEQESAKGRKEGRTFQAATHRSEGT